ncbi:hypothetical protein [Ancylobacter oerskovii]|uniref:Uncharacterized protein n=1 Tax=Ancylobacter oerskovii TaxID=459519 RepID=A0ABW4YYY9_9HYPH
MQNSFAVSDAAHPFAAATAANAMEAGWQAPGTQCISSQAGAVGMSSLSEETP